MKKALSSQSTLFTRKSMLMIIKTEGNRAPVAKTGLNKSVNEGADNLTFTASDLATDADGNDLTFVAGSATSATIDKMVN